MNFDLSDDNRMLANNLRRFLSDKYDIATRNRHAYARPWQVPEIWDGLAELGILSAFVTEQQGGYGGSAEEIAVIFEEVGRGLCAEPLLGALLGVRLLAELTQTEMVKKIVDGTARPALAVYEPQAAFNLSYIEATACQQAGGWRLSGRKSAIYGASDADYVLVAARTNDGIGLFLIDAPDLIAATMVDGGNTADLVMAELPATCLSSNCRDLLENTLDLGRIGLCAEAVGAMDHLIELTISHMTQRHQFGRPLASFQALQHRVVNMLAELEQCRSITILAVTGFGRAHQAKTVSQAKNLIGRMGRMVAEEAIQLHGGIGVSWEYPGAHYAKRLVMIDHQLGDHIDQVGRIISLSAASGEAA